MYNFIFLCLNANVSVIFFPISKRESQMGYVEVAMIIIHFVLVSLKFKISICGLQVVFVSLFVSYFTSRFHLTVPSLPFCNWYRAFRRFNGLSISFRIHHPWCAYEFIKSKSEGQHRLTQRVEFSEKVSLELKEWIRMCHYQIPQIEHQIKTLCCQNSFLVFWGFSSVRLICE